MQLNVLAMFTYRQILKSVLRAVLFVVAVCWIGVDDAQAGATLEGPIPAQVTRVIDGDTIEVRALIWLGQEILVRVRLAGIDAPELTASCESARSAAFEARAFVVREVEGARIVLSHIHGDKYFGRVISRVQTPKGEDLSDSLLNAGLARPYSGGRREPAC